MAKLNKLMADSSSQNKTIGYTYGKVVSYNSDTCKAVVELTEYNNAQKTYLNKSGEELAKDDSVWIYYRDGGVNCGYIALRNGKPKPIGSDSHNYVGEPIYYTDSEGYLHTSEKFNYYDNGYWHTSDLNGNQQITVYLENIAHGATNNC